MNQQACGERSESYLSQECTAGNKDARKWKKVPNPGLYHRKMQPYLSTPHQDNLSHAEHQISKKQRHNGVARHLEENDGSLHSQHCGGWVGVRVRASESECACVRVHACECVCVCVDLAVVDRAKHHQLCTSCNVC